MKLSVARVSFLATFAAACAADPAADATPPRSNPSVIDERDLLAHIAELSSDRYEGRAPGSAGEELTVGYLTREFAALGLAPGIPDGTYVQRVPLVGFQCAPRFELTLPGGSKQLQFPSDYVALTRRDVPSLEVAADIVFVGYGVEAPEYGWDDFKGVDVAVRSVLAFLERAAEQQGHAGAHSGAVVFVQRFGGALNLNLHFHALVVDGAYARASTFARPVFHAAPRLADADVEQLTRTLHGRVTRYLRRKGHLPREHDVERDSTPEPDLLALISAASVQGRAALAAESNPPVARIGRRREVRALFVPGALCCDYDGFSLHAKVVVPVGQRERLEHLCRYVARPAIASERLALAPDGRVVYGLRRHRRDGTSAISFDPLAFIERLAALVPRPRCHLVTYHGVLAPAAQWRDLIVPAVRSSPEQSPTIRSAARRSTWAELL